MSVSIAMMDDRMCRGCGVPIPEQAHANRRWCGTDECERERRRRSSRMSYLANRDERAAQLREYNRQHRAEERARYHSRYRTRKLARMYGVTMAEMDAVLAVRQCQICGKPEDLVVDHDHATGRIRGRLCQSCNRALGLIGDDLKRLREAVRYLEGAM